MRKLLQGKILWKFIIKCVYVSVSAQKIWWTSNHSGYINTRNLNSGLCWVGIFCTKKKQHKTVVLVSHADEIRIIVISIVHCSSEIQVLFRPKFKIIKNYFSNCSRSSAGTAKTSGTISAKPESFSTCTSKADAFFSSKHRVCTLRE